MPNIILYTRGHLIKYQLKLCSGKGGNVTSVGWQESLNDPVWHMSSRSGVAYVANCYNYLFTSVLYCKANRTPYDKEVVTAYCTDTAVCRWLKCIY